MKGVFLLFVVLAVSGILWGYASKETRKSISQTVKRNIVPIVMSAVFVTVVLFFSLNTTLRFV